MSGQATAEEFRATFDAIRAEVCKAIVGQNEIVTGVLTGLAANGHVLLEGMPGLGKTLLVRSLADSVGLSFSRVQFTPDLMPADVTGTNVFVPGESGQRAFAFRPGPVFANLVLADEINRATPKTQSALLEAMQERAVTVGGTKHELEEPFLVMATQNPIEQEGTYPLPEAQLDRFFMKLLVPYPSKAELADIVNRTTGADLAKLSAVADRVSVLRLRKIVQEVPVAENVLDYGLSIVVATHPASDEAPEFTKRFVRYGSSPRGAQSMVLGAKVSALLDGRYNVSKADLRSNAKSVLRHRIGVNFEAEAEGITTDEVIDRVLDFVDQHDRDPVRV